MRVDLYHTTGAKKMVAIIDQHHIYFGAAGMSDYTIHKDADRKKRYITRHKAHEDWTRSGIYTAGFYSRWILWNKPSLRESINATANRFGLEIILHRKKWPAGKK